MKAPPHRIGQKVDFGTQDTCIEIVQLWVMRFLMKIGKNYEAHQHTGLSHNRLFWAMALVGPVTNYPAVHSVSGPFDALDHGYYMVHIR